MRDHKITLFTLAFLLAAGLGRITHAQESAAFLNMGYGARSMAMGNTSTALAADSDAIYWNPAGLAAANQTQIGMTRAQMFLGDTYDAVSVAVPLGTRMGTRYEKLGYRNTAVATYNEPIKRGVLGFGVTRLAHSEQQGRDLNRRRTNSFDASDIAVSIGYSRSILRRMSAGLAFKKIESKIADRSAGTYAADFGAMYQFRGARRWRLGAAVRNMGPGLRYDREASPLPLSFSVGTGFEALPNLMVASEIQVRPNADKIVWSLGTEYAILPTLSLRGGLLQDQFSAEAVGNSNVGLGSFGGGLGFKWGRFDLDYSITPFGILGNISRFSLRARF
jgi:hypothetical protein